MPQAPAGQSSSELPLKEHFGYFSAPLKSDSYSQGLASKKSMDGTPKQPSKLTQEQTSKLTPKQKKQKHPH